jgi:hypothetical protein
MIATLSPVPRIHYPPIAHRTPRQCTVIDVQEKGRHDSLNLSVLAPALRTNSQWRAFSTVPVPFPHVRTQNVTEMLVRTRHQGQLVR